MPGRRVYAPVVTISATYGAGGSIVAPLLADRLGIPFADRLIPARGTPSAGTVATPTGSPDAPCSPGGAKANTDTDAKLETTGERLSPDEAEAVARRSFFSRLAHLTGGLGLPVPDAADLREPVREQVEASIAALARAEGGVILGRGGALALADDPWAYHVRLDGPQDRRCRQAMTIESIDAATALDRLVETDRARTRYISRLYDRDPADPHLYHLVLDSTAIPLEMCVDLITTAARGFWAAAAR